MGFREFITNFRYRRQVEAAFERQQRITPDAHPSRRHIDKLVKKLLNERTIEGAHRELELIGAAAVPSLLAVVDDPRFHRADWESSWHTTAPLEAMLELLVDHAGDDVVRVASPLARSTSDETRKTAAMHLASVGRASTIPILNELMQDEDGYVRSSACTGIHRAVSSGRAEETFRKQAYELLLSQLDQRWGNTLNDAANTVVVLDPARAATDLGTDRWLNLANGNTSRIIEACNRANILLPDTLLRRLLNEALPLAVGDRCYPNDYVVASALSALALHKADDAADLATSLLDHENDHVKEAAADALATLAGIDDPTRFVIERVTKDGYGGLSREQRVVYCAFLFDAEVCNGGLMQFFGNSSGDHAADVLEALAELGNNEAHTVLKTAMRLVGPRSRETNRERRLMAFEGRWDELQPAFDSLEAAYYKTKTSLRQAWLLYAVHHAQQFRD